MSWSSAASLSYVNARPPIPRRVPSAVANADTMASRVRAAVRHRERHPEFLMRFAGVRLDAVLRFCAYSRALRPSAARLPDPRLRAGASPPPTHSSRRKPRSSTLNVPRRRRRPATRHRRSGAARGCRTLSPPSPECPVRQSRTARVNARRAEPAPNRRRDARRPLSRLEAVEVEQGGAAWIYLRRGEAARRARTSAAAYFRAPSDLARAREAGRLAEPALLFLEAPAHPGKHHEDRSRRDTVDDRCSRALKPLPSRTPTNTPNREPPCRCEKDA